MWHYGIQWILIQADRGLCSLLRSGILRECFILKKERVGGGWGKTCPVFASYWNNIFTYLNHLIFKRDLISKNVSLNATRPFLYFIFQFKPFKIMNLQGGNIDSFKQMTSVQPLKHFQHFYLKLKLQDIDRWW